MTQIIGILILGAVVVALFYMLWKPQWVVLLIVVQFPLEQLITSYVPTLGGLASWKFNVGVGIFAILAVISSFVKQERPMLGHRNPVTVMIVGLYLLSFISVLWTSSDNWRYLFGVGWPYWGLYLGLMPLLIRDVREVQRVFLGVMIVGMFIAVLILINPNSSFRSGRLTLDIGVYATQHRSNPLALASLGSMIALLAILIRFERADWIFSGFRLAALVLGLGLAIVSGSRGQVIAAGAAGVMFYPLARQIKDPKQFIVVGIGSIIAAGMVLMTFRLFIGHENINRWDLGNMADDAGSRFEMVAALGSAWMQSPMHWVLGLGTGAFDTVYGKAYVHNLVAEVMFEHGIVGMLLLVGILYYTFRGGQGLFDRYRDDASLRSIVAVLCAICMFQFVLSLKQGSFLIVPAPFYWFLVLAKIAAREQIVAVEEGADDLYDESAYEEETALDPAYGHAV